MKKSNLISHLREQGFVDDTNDKIISVGLQRLKSLLIDIIFSLLLGFLLGDPWAGLLFELSYSIIRIYAGGYHASTERICMWLTYISTFLCIVLIFYSPIVPSIMHLLIGLSVMMLIIFSPVENANKPLGKREKKVYRQKCLFLTLLEIILYILFVYNNALLYARAISFALAMVALGQVADFIQRRVVKH